MFSIHQIWSCLSFIFSFIIWLTIPSGSTWRWRSTRDQQASSLVILTFSLPFLPCFSTVFLYSLPWVENLSVAVLVLFSNISKSSHGRVFFHIKVFLGSVLIWTPWDLKRRWTKYVYLIVLLHSVHSEKPFCSSSCRAPMEGFYSISWSSWDQYWFGHRDDHQILAFKLFG